jgi:hypothetical protein
MALVGERSSATPHLALDLSGPLVADALAHAVELLGRRHPIVTCTVEPHVTAARWTPASTGPALGVAEMSTSLPEIDLVRGPVCRVLYERTTGSCRLRVGVHHAIADATGILVLADDLRRIYTALAEGRTPIADVDWSPRSIRALLDAHDVGPRERARLAFEGQDRWARVQRSTHLDAAREPAPERANAGERVPLALSADTIDAIVAADPRRGWRPNHVLLAALARSWQQVIGHAPGGPATSGWLVGVNCRAPLGMARGVGNLSGFEPVAFDAGSGRSLTATVDSVRDALTPLRGLGAGMAGELAASYGSSFLDLTPPELLSRAMETIFGMRADVSRLTRVYTPVIVPDSLADWGSARALDAWWEPVTRVADPYVALVPTRFQRSILLTSIASNESLPDGELRALVDAAEHELTQLAHDVGSVPA